MRYHNITKDDMLNGYGIRTVLWVAGCEHNCPGCHNPITHDINGGIVFDVSAKQEIFEELKKDYVSGITYSGGDPLHPINANEIGELIKEIAVKFPNKNQWLYTGYMFEDIIKYDFIKLLDVVCDGKFEIKLFDRNLKWVGSSNQRVIDVKKTISQNKIVLFDDNFDGNPTLKSYK
ncbi:anaerobic ribonucleoside-triphosphate reductase activating protein [Malacoplasma iowae]|nr:anaerobic ribonucleoside-triphosphate reductase activating protein [Malacoplasma iowae]VEU62964.1 anaerobic ribonucleotide reductase-activating protein [Mycoplasmopsis fermentans]EGZ31749.1 anaerobic ribonucleoside-triphosphate reductase activating protein NrdG [Malacoplasma iowae 695]QHG89467.1 anaerobic ribonucleoside-triphosphate reductase activating protein [Malacoplasma iowae 695]WPL35811.1 anaerobic ribonucleoside-triphosphate reductase activating protein [Malacoplasma iowae]WPL36699.